MNPARQLLLVALTFVVVLGLRTLFQSVYRRLTSPIRHLCGPKATSWFYGNMRDILDAKISNSLEEWLKLYGNTLKFKSFFSSDQLLTVDLGAVNYVLTHSNDYQKPSPARYILSQVLDKGVVVVEGAEHRRQRHIMNPAFGPAQIRGLTDIFFEKSHQLCEVLSSEIIKDPTGTTSGARIDVLTWLSKTALDIIGLAGFNCKFDSLTANGKSNELSTAFATLVDASQSPNILVLLQAQFPLLRIIPSALARKIQASRRTMSRVGKELLSSSKAAARASATVKGEIEKNSLCGRDLLSLLVKANIATDIPESQKLSDEDVLAQVPTFLIAGHETTAVVTARALYAITKAPELQAKLREELLSVDTETPSMDELMALQYLDAVVRETLRVHPPIPAVLRIATKDDVIPVKESYTDRYGVVHDSIGISQGDIITIPIAAINLSRELWGPDAHEFKPERWESIPGAVSPIPGVWGHLMTFLGGPRACIGYRLSIVEMKALLFTLVRTFEFGHAVPVHEVGERLTVLLRPVLRSDPTYKPQLPLLIKPYKRT